MMQARGLGAPTSVHSFKKPSLSDEKFEDFLLLLEENLFARVIFNQNVRKDILTVTVPAIHMIATLNKVKAADTFR